MDATNETTRILEAASGGDPQAASKLLVLIYDQLRELAALRLAQEQPGISYTATALVHEAYLRLTEKDPKKQWDGRRHFFSAAAEAMRRILIENARKKGRLRHGGDHQRVFVDLSALADPTEEERLLELDDALERLSEEEPEVAALVKLRYFAGLTLEEAAEVQGISLRTANRHWSYAKAWLYKRLSN